MKPITLKEIAKSCGGKLHGDENVLVTSIVTDSRQVQGDTLFAAIKGERVDGHKFIAQCIESGAVCALCEDEPEIDCNYIQVDSTLVALKKIAEYYRSLFSIPFIGITGSVGKTSTKEMISSVLSQKFCVHKTQGNFNNELGVPLTIFKLEREHEIAVIEMGISDFTEMTRLSKIVRPDISVITNIGCCHLENLIDRDGVLKAKTEMLEFLSSNGKMFFCGDDDKLYSVKEHNGIKTIFYGFSDHNEYKAEIINTDLQKGINCKLYLKNGVVEATVPSVESHMVANALCAAAIGEHLGMTLDEIKCGIESYKTVGSRSNIIRKEALTIIDDCYNANPTSVRASIDTLSKFLNRKVAIIGDMKELGTNECALHFETGEYIAQKGIDTVVAVGELSKHLFDGAKEKGYYFETVDECIEKIYDIIKSGDTVLVKASHSMHFDKIVDALNEHFI
ncbi:MAG: UDP-N-acetylmuramoyl-tripeptide--D-alanyl-D-alanine ligase [Ruminococcaceae bacterium]|nr:UDP-N-acetylmuramoyl-tripeptide--D-alanyl-D-alanine ligase [Oscillospiraceae bacterium]